MIAAGGKQTNNNNKIGTVWITKYSPKMGLQQTGKSAHSLATPTVK